MDAATIERRIREFPYWHYQFDLQGHLTPVADGGEVARHQWRLGYLFDPLVASCGGSLAGKRVLDLGCNGGYWSLAAIERGAEFVLGIDGRESYVEQARFVFEAMEVAPERYDFRTVDLFDLGFEGEQFDIVLALGLMMHISKPVELLELVDRSGADVLLIDTSISLAPGAFFQIRRQGESALARHAVGLGLRMLPTKYAVAELTREFGFATWVLKPTFSAGAGVDACADYRRGLRRGFLCARRDAAKRVDVASEPLGRSALLRDAVMWTVNAARGPAHRTS